MIVEINLINTNILYSNKLKTFSYLNNRKQLYIVYKNNKYSAIVHPKILPKGNNPVIAVVILLKFIFGLNK